MEEQKRIASQSRPERLQRKHVVGIAANARSDV